MAMQDYIAALSGAGASSTPGYGLTPDQLLSQQKLSQEDMQQALGVMMGIADVANKNRQLQLQQDQLAAETDYKNRSLTLMSDELAFKKIDAQAKNTLEAKKLDIERQNANTNAQLAKLRESEVTADNELTRTQIKKLEDESALNTFKLDALKVLDQTTVDVNTKDGKTFKMSLGTAAATGVMDDVLHDKSVGKGQALQLVDELVAQGVPRSVALIMGPLQKNILSMYQNRLASLEKATMQPATDEQRYNEAREAVRISFGLAKATAGSGMADLPNEDAIMDMLFGDVAPAAAKGAKGKKPGITINLPKDAVDAYGKE